MADTSAQYKDLSILVMLTIKLLGSPDTPAYALAEALISRLGYPQTNDLLAADVAIAPLLTERVPTDLLNAPRFGTLIFHPSPLPYGRGASAIKWAYKRSEPITAATWFWATEGLDEGDICEQEIVRIDYSLRPREFYLQHVLPAMLRTLDRALNDLNKGYKRAIPQVAAYASYDSRL